MTHQEAQVKEQGEVKGDCNERTRANENDNGHTGRPALAPKLKTCPPLHSPDLSAISGQR